MIDPRTGDVVPDRTPRRWGSQAWIRQKRAVWQGKLCTYCPSPASGVDHVVPLSRGGAEHVDNMVPACRSCNSKKGNRQSSVQTTLF